MEKTLKIGKQSVTLSNNVSWALEYKDQFGRDVIQEHVPVMASIMETVAGAFADSEEVDFRSIVTSFEGRAMEIMIPLMQTEFMETIINITWAMAKAANDDIEPPKQWLKQFDVFPLDIIAPTVYEMALKGFVSSKNRQRLKDLMKKMKIDQPSTLKPLSSQESKED